MFPLLRYFSLISAVFIGLAMAVVSVVLTQTTNEQLVEERQNSNKSLTRIFSNSVWQEFREHVKASAELDGDALRAAPKTKELLRDVRNLMRDLTIVKVKVYSLNGNTVFSTEAGQMGDSKIDIPGFLSARRGEPTSGYSYRSSFSAFENEIFDVDVVASYIPIYDSDGQIEAVFEVYDNVTASLEKMEARKNLILAFVGGLFALLYLALLLVVRRATGILELQHKQILSAKAELEDTNGELFKRTQQLEAAQESLIQQERLATLGELTATVSHELRNPLAAIRSSIHLAIKKTEDNDLGIARSLERAERNVMRCDDIISDLLGYASEPACQTEVITADDWLRETLSELEVPEEVILVQRLSAPDARLSVAPERIRQVVVNLFENAIQALADMPSGSRRILTVRSSLQKDGYSIAFQDTGPGMDEDTVGKVFEPLFSTKSYGCGLGLATARKIMEKHDGSIHFDSEVDVGTTVTMSLPASRAHERAA